LIGKIKSRFNNDSWDLLSSTVGAFLARSLGAVGQFLFTVYLGRTLGAEGSGVYMLALSTSVAGSVLGRAGLDLTLVRFTSISFLKNDYRQLKNNFQKTILLGTSFSLIIVGVIFVLSPWLCREILNNESLIEPLRWMSLSILPFSVLNIIAEGLRGIKKILYANLVQATFLPIFNILYFSIFLHYGLETQGAIYSYFASCVTSVLIGLFFWFKVTASQQGSTQKNPLLSLSEILKVSLPTLWITLMGMASGLAETFIMGLYHSPKDVGVFSAAVRLSLLISFVLVATNSFLGHKFAQLEKGNYLKTEKLAQLGTKIMVLSALPLILLYLIFPSYILSIYGPEFKAGAVTLVILTLGQAYHVFTGSADLLLLMGGHEKSLQKITTFAVIVNIICGFILVPSLGATGAAIATIAGIITSKTLSLIISRRKTKVSTIPWTSGQE
jgi:O-antigen/teichoic acid export membrane protein